MSIISKIYNAVIKPVFKEQLEKEIKSHQIQAHQEAMAQHNKMLRDIKIQEKMYFVGHPVISFSGFSLGEDLDEGFLEIGFVKNIDTGISVSGNFICDFYNAKLVDKSEQVIQKIAFTKVYYLTGHSLLTFLQMTLAQLHLVRMGHESYASEKQYRSYPSHSNPYKYLPYQRMIKDIRHYVVEQYHLHNEPHAQNDFAAVNDFERTLNISEGQRDALIKLAKKFHTDLGKKPSEVVDLYKAFYAYNRQALVDLIQSPVNRELFSVMNQYCACVQLALFTMTRENLQVHQG